MENVFFHVHSVGVGDRFIVPVSTKFPEMVLRFPIVSIAIRNILQITTNCFC